MAGDDITFVDAWIIALKQEYDPTGYGMLFFALLFTMIAITQVKEA